MHKLVSICVLTAAVLAASVTAQGIHQGDLVLSSANNTSGVFYTTWPSNTLNTLRSGFAAAGVKMKSENVWVNVIGTSGASLEKIYLVSRYGYLNTFTTLIPSGCVALELDQDGTYMVANNRTDRLYRTTKYSVTTFVTFGSSQGHPSAICRDGTGGDWIVGTSLGNLFSVDRVSGYTKEIYSSGVFSAIFGVAYMPQTGEFAVARSRYVIPPFPGKTIQELAIIDSAGSVNHTREIKDASAVAVNHKTGRIYVATSSGSVVELSSSAKILASRSYGSHDFTGIDIWDDQNVSLETTGERGALVEIELKFFESQAMPYAAALSLGERPGLAFGPGNVLNLTPDPLFFLTAAGALPFWTTGFAGTTDSTGGAEAEFYIPWGLPVGTCMYVGAAAVNAAFPDNLDVGNVECIQVR